jgi:PAS domain S-box-containing protein
VEARLFEVSIQEMRSGGGMPPAKLVIMRDVTDRTRAEERAVHLASFPELTPVLILEADPDGSILYANPSCVSSLQEMGETDPRMFIPQDLRDRLDGTVIAESLHEVREIELHGRLFRENVYFTPQFSSIRIYATDITDRDKTEAALRESEEKYREFFTTSRDSVFITTPEGQWVDFNDTALEMFGYGSREELMALPLPDLYLHPGQRGDLLTRIEREGYVKEFAVQLIKKDGSVIDTLITAVPLQNPDGSIKAFVGSIRDITDQKRAEDALRESERKFRETVKTLDEGYYSCTLDGMLLEHNVAFNRILGIDADLDLKGTQLPDFWQNPDDRTPYVEELLAKGFIQNFSINAKTVQGTNIVVLANSHLVKDENDRIVRIDGTFTDFTERKRAEEGLRESEEKFATAFKTSPYAITITRATDGSFIDVNDAFTQITGYTHEETVINSSIGLDLWVNMEDRKRVLFDLIGGRNVVGREFLFRRKDGVIMTGLFSAQIILLNNEPCILSSISDITERKDAEERLRQSAIRFRSLIQNSSDMIRIIDQNGRIVYGSDSTRRILGYTPESLLGTDPLDFIHPDDLGKVRADLKQVCDRINPGTPTEFRIRKADGEYIWVDSVGINLLDEPSVNGIVVTTRPIQQRKLAEDALRESETRFRTMADWTYDWEYWIDHQKNVVYMSPSVERVTGYPAKDFSADRDLIDRIVHPDDRAAWDSHVSLHTQHETADDPVEIEFRILTREGKIRWISHTCRTICSDTTTCIGRRVSNRDITDRKRAEEELRETNEYLNNLFNYANAPIITWDPEFQITRFNHAFEHLAGRLQEEVLGEKLDILFPAVSKEASLSLITKALEGERWETVEIPILNADGSTRSVLWNSANVLGRDGNVIATIAQGVDSPTRSRPLTGSAGSQVSRN